MLRSRNRMWLCVILALAITVAFAGVALALASGPVDEDAAVYSIDPALNQNADKLRAEAGTTVCENSRTRWSYLKWNVADAAGKLGDYAKITLVADLINLGSASQGQVYIGLYETTDSWMETSVTAGNGPAIGSLLLEIPVPSAPGNLVFEGGAGTPLVTYLMSQANGDGVASLILALRGNCGEGSVLVRTWSKDQANSSISPTLDLRAGGPNAVDMSGASAERVSWPLYAGLGALGVILGIGMAVTRRKMA